MRVIEERDILQHDICVMDRSFNDLAHRFGRLRHLLKNLQENERMMNQGVKQYSARLKEEQSRYAQFHDTYQETVQRSPSTVCIYRSALPDLLPRC